jgi:hypothetical protein
MPTTAMPALMPATAVPAPAMPATAVPIARGRRRRSADEDPKTQSREKSETMFHFKPPAGRLITGARENLVINRGNHWASMCHFVSQLPAVTL